MPAQTYTNRNCENRIKRVGRRLFGFVLCNLSSLCTLTIVCARACVCTSVATAFLLASLFRFVAATIVAGAGCHRAWFPHAFQSEYGWIALLSLKRYSNNIINQMHANHPEHVAVDLVGLLAFMTNKLFLFAAEFGSWFRIQCGGWMARGYLFNRLKSYLAAIHGNYSRSLNGWASKRVRLKSVLRLETVECKTSANWSSDAPKQLMPLRASGLIPQ